MNPHFKFILHVSILLMHCVELILEVGDAVVRLNLPHFRPIKFALEPQNFVGEGIISLSEE
jgi:hypothetical protein